MMRLRAGKRQRSGRVPGGASDSSTPADATACHSSCWWGG